jgi:hypothetical protein
MLRMQEMKKHARRHHHHHKDEDTNKDHKEDKKDVPHTLKGMQGTFFEQFHSVQMLHAEWGPWIATLFLYIHLQSQYKNIELSNTMQWLIIVLTFSRFMFPLRPFIGHLIPKWPMIWMMTCYISFMWLMILGFQM